LAKQALVCAASSGALSAALADSRQHGQPEMARTFTFQETGVATPIRSHRSAPVSPAFSASGQRGGLLPSSPATDCSEDLRKRTALLLLPTSEEEEMFPATGPPEHESKRLRLIVQRVTGLRTADAVAFSEPSCVLEIRGRDQVLQKRFRTKVIDNELYPVWNEKYDFDFEVGDELCFSLWEQEEFLGVARLTDKMILPNGFDNFVELLDTDEQFWESQPRLYLKIRPLEQK